LDLGLGWGRCMSVRVVTPAMALACVLAAAPATVAADGLPYRGREAVQARTYGVERGGAIPLAAEALPKPTAVAAMAAVAPVKAVAVEGMKPLSQEDLAGAMGDGATRDPQIDGATHNNVLKIGGRTSDSAASRIEGSTFTRFHPDAAPQAPEGLTPLSPLGSGGVGFTIIQARGF